MTTKPKNYTASPAHAKRAKVGDKLGAMSYDPDPKAPRYVSHAWYEVTKVHADGSLTVKTSTGRKKTLKPDTDRGGRRLAWWYLEMQPYRQNIYVFIENDRDRKLQAESAAEYARERRNEERRKDRQASRSKDVYDQLVALAEQHGLLLRGSGGQPKLKPAGEDGSHPQGHTSLKDLMPYWSDEVGLADVSIQLPVELLLTIINKD